MPWGHWFQWIYYNLTGSPKNFRYSEATAKLVVNMGFGCGCLANKIKVNNTKSDDMKHVMTARDIWHAKAYVSNVTSILKSSIHKSHCSEFCNLAASLWNPAIKQSTLHQGPPVSGVWCSGGWYLITIKNIMGGRGASNKIMTTPNNFEEKTRQKVERLFSYHHYIT